MRAWRITATVRDVGGVLFSSDIANAASAGFGRVFFTSFPILDEKGLIPKGTPIRAGRVWMIITGCRRYYAKGAGWDQEGDLYASIRRAKYGESKELDNMHAVYVVMTA